jgi:thiamine kinase-like enzyme
MIISKDDFYLIDWELATYGDLAYELAMHFILMEYTGQEKDIFFSKLVKNIDLDVKKLMNDVEIYITFELYRRKVLKELKK